MKKRLTGHFLQSYFTLIFTILKLSNKKLSITLNNRSNGLQATNASRPRVFRQRALNTLGKEART